MGRWMEIVREQPPQGRRDHDRAYEELIVREIAPHPLMHAFATLCRANPRKRKLIRTSFPTLSRVGLGSPNYVDDDLWLPAKEVGQLLEEFQRLRRVCRREEFILGIDGQSTYELWRGSDRTEDFDPWLDRIEALLREALESDYWVRLML